MKGAAATNAWTARAMLAAGIASMLLLSGSANAAGPNLAPNPSFELSVFEPAPVPQYTQPQPLLPVGWGFEGLAGLFDHSPNGHVSGQRMAAISIPASTKRQICYDQPVGCYDSPANIVKEAIKQYASVAPYWRTIQPVPVTAGTSYKFSVHTWLSFVTLGEGAVTQIRWTDASGIPIGVTAGPSRLQKESDAPDTGWIFITKNVTAPTGARGAIVMLGHSDDIWPSQVRYDDVHFGAA